MPRFVNFKDFKGQAVVVNADQVIYVRSFGSVAKTEIAFAVAQQGEALCVVVEGTVDSVTRQLNGEFAGGYLSQPPEKIRRRSSRPPVGERGRLIASRI